MLDLSKHKPESLFDSTWVDDYISKMGEKAFWDYRNKVYDRLLLLKAGEEINVAEKVKPENYDLFIKMAYCFVSETKISYGFNPEHTIFKRYRSN